MLRCAIVGCGNISSLLDSPKAAHVTTHAHAYRDNDLTELVAVCDPSSDKRQRFKAKWGNHINAYENTEDLLNKENIDVLSICSPTKYHFEAIKLALGNENVQFILCEKPVVQTLSELTQIYDLVKVTTKNLQINFIRRFDPSHNEVKSLIEHGNIGKIVSFNASFTKGLLHNGSHLLELIQHLCGGIKSIEIIDAQNIDDDLQGIFHLQTDKASGVIQNFSGSDYALFELDILFSKGRIKILDSGESIEVYNLQKSKIYNNYNCLGLKNTLKSTMQKNMKHSISHLITADKDNFIFLEHLKLSKLLLKIKNELYEKKKLIFNIDKGRKK